MIQWFFRLFFLNFFLFILFYQYTLGIFDVERDDYPTMKVALKEIVESTNGMNKKVSILGVEYSIEWSLGGDLAWINTERGMQSCSSNYPCFRWALLTSRMLLCCNAMISKLFWLKLDLHCSKIKKMIIKVVKSISFKPYMPKN